MKVRVITQLNRCTRQKNVILTRDFLAPVEDFLIGSWPESDVKDGIVLILAWSDDTIIERLLDTELRSEDDPEIDGEIIITPEMAARCKALLARS